MSESSHDVTEQAPPEVVTPPVPQLSVGTTLREARELSGMSVNEVSSRIKFAPRQIEALEADDFALLPEITFVRGFVRSYARLLALDEMALLAALPQANTRPAPEEANVLAEVPFPNAYSTRKPNIMWLGAALGVAVVLGLFVWLHGGVVDAPESQSRQQALELPDAAPMTAEPETALPTETIAAPMVPMATVTPAPIPAPASKAASPAAASVEKPAPVKPAEIAKPAPLAAPAKPAVAAAPAAAPVAPAARSAEVVAAKPLSAPTADVAVNPAASKPVVSPTTAGDAQGTAVLHFVFDNESWVEVKDGNGKPLLGQLNAPGTEINVRGEPPFTLLVGNSGGVRLTYKGKSIDLAPHSNAQVAHLTLE